MPITDEAGMSLQSVIIIDDEEFILRLAKKLLDKHCTNCEVSLFDSAEAAVNELQERSRNETLTQAIIVIDGNLKKDDGAFRIGHEVVRLLRDQEYGDKLYIIAHSSDLEHNERMLCAGANASVHKELIETLPSAVSAALGRN